MITICTEENPQRDEVEFILHQLGHPCRVIGLSSSVKDDVWNGTFTAETDNPSLDVIILLVKGSGSFVDYVVYDTPSPTGETTPKFLMESTKTKDSESRNSAIYQRFTKFAVARQFFPKTPLYLYYNTVQKPTSQTNDFGRRLLKTFGIKAYDVTERDLLVETSPFSTVEELIEAKNAFKERKGNVSVRISRSIADGHTYKISAKMSKGKNTLISHDPNKGLVTGMASVIHMLDPHARFVVTNHFVDLEKVKKAKEKFWYANSSYDLRLEGCDLSSKDTFCKTNYWSSDERSEKAATINYQLYMEKNGWKTIYHNHSSSARSHFIDTTGKSHQVPKDATIPDVVVVHEGLKRVQICEGKIFKDCRKGVAQLDNLTKFIEYLESHYEGYVIERGLCVYGRTLTEVKSVENEFAYPVFFALDSTGSMLH